MDSWTYDRRVANSKSNSLNSNNSKKGSAIRGLSNGQIELIKAIQIDSIRANTDRNISLIQMSHILIEHIEIEHSELKEKWLLFDRLLKRNSQ